MLSTDNYLLGTAIARGRSYPSSNPTSTSYSASIHRHPSDFEQESVEWRRREDFHLSPLNPDQHQQWTGHLLASLGGTTAVARAALHRHRAVHSSIRTSTRTPAAPRLSQIHRLQGIHPRPRNSYNASSNGSRTLRRRLGTTRGTQMRGFKTSMP